MRVALILSVGRHQQQTLKYSHILVMRFIHSRDQESPHKPKGKRTTETIMLPGNTRHSFRDDVSSVSYD